MQIANKLLTKSVNKFRIDFLTNQICLDKLNLIYLRMFYSLDKMKPNKYMKLKTKTQDNIVIWAFLKQFD